MANQLIMEKNEGACRTLILNRPEVRNAFNPPKAKALGDSLKKAGKDHSIRVVVLRGVEKVFSAGGDLKFFSENLAKIDEIFRVISSCLNDAIHHITSMSKPVIAAVEGPAYAAGFGLALSCDIVVASQSATLSPSFINIALAPNASSTYFLPRILGPRLATEAFLRGRVFSATEARELGMVNHVWSEELFEEKLKRLVNDLESRPTLTVGRIKKLLKNTFHQSFAEQLEAEKDQIVASSLNDDFLEGLKAFLEKRKPVFKGK